jgi:SAM-dependent methyltransferase
MMFSRSAQLYDLFYSFKDYGRETQHLHEIIGKHKQSTGNLLLDIACGTGHHIQYLKRLYSCQGLDLDEQLLQVARQNNPGVTFHCADMVDFRLDERFDVITCLFSAIGYTQTLDKLEKALASFAVHLRPGGAVVVEPWFSKEQWFEGRPHAVHVDLPDLKATRMNVSRLEDGLSILDFHYLVATNQGVDYFTERHQLGLFSQEEYIQAFRKAGLQVSYDEQGLTGRGLYSGVKPGGTK